MKSSKASMKASVKAYEMVQQDMKSGNNCCQAVLRAALAAWEIGPHPEMQIAASMFGGGIGSGCTCGALAGMVMAAGLRMTDASDSERRQFAAGLHDSFKEEFGSTCCRVIKKKQGLTGTIGGGACRDLSGRTVIMLLEKWEQHAGQ